MKKKMGNGGFTLVELLVAVLILGIITAPLLHAFVTSSHTFAKSRSIGEATQAAENLAETVEATPIKTLASLYDLAAFSTGTVSGLNAEDYVYSKDLSGNYQKNDDGTLKETSAPVAHADPNTNASRYTLQLTDVKSGNSAYNAKIELDTKPYVLENLKKVTEYTAMDAVFSQPSGSSENPDFLASDAFLDQAVALGGSETLAAGHFDHGMKRYITISVTQEDGEYIASASYDYSCIYRYTVTTVGADGVVKSEEHSTTLTANYSFEFYRSATAPISLYVFFFPNYNSALPLDDEITILNTKDLSFSMFLIKQKAITRTGPVSETAIGSYETGYSALVNLKETVRLSKPHASVFSNISRNISDLNTNPAIRLPVTFRVYYGPTWYLPDSLLEDLVDQEEQNRLYRVTITLYDSKSGAQLYSMQSTKLG